LCFGWPSPKLFLILCWITSASFVHASFAQTTSNERTAALPIILDNSQLDFVTAGSGSVTLDLSASAQGVGATSSTAGSVQTARSTLLRVALDGPDVARARLLGVDPVDYVFAVGQASANGESNAQCTASLVTAIDLIFIVRLSVAAVTATSATCSCAAFAISPVGP
jgi:hypothetical protein